MERSRANAGATKTIGGRVRKTKIMSIARRILMDRDNGGNLTQLFLHEYIHALTLSSRLAETKVGRELIALFTKYKKVQGPRTDYGFDTVYAFFSEALRTPEFPKYLISLPVEGVCWSFWNA